jgi:hypothetical protein
MRERVIAVVKYVLAVVGNYMQQQVIDSSKSGWPPVDCFDISIVIQSGEHIIESLQYISISTEVKMKAFDVSTLN